MLLIGRERGKGQIGKIPGPSPSKSGKTQKNPRKRTKKDKKGRTSPDRENPPFEAPRLAALEEIVHFGAQKIARVRGERSKLPTATAENRTILHGALGRFLRGLVHMGSEGFSPFFFFFAFSFFFAFFSLLFVFCFFLLFS